MSDPIFPIVVTAAGAQPTPPATLNAGLIATVAASDPGYTILPGGLIEDVASTDTGALILIDSFRVEIINSLTPLGANSFLLIQLGQQFGIPIGRATNTSVYEVFEGLPGFPIAVGFTVSDGTYQYTVQDGGIIQADGFSAPLFCLATIVGSWAVPPGTVTQLITSVPEGISLSVTNPNAGLPGAGEESQEDYRAQVLQAQLAASQGMSRYLKTLLGKVSGVQSRLVRAIAQAGGGWLIMVGGGDPYAVANAIWTALFDISTLVGSTIGITAITKANPGVVTTNISHGLTEGQDNVAIAAVLGMTAANGGPYTVHVIDDTHFSFGVNTSSFGVYTSGGVVTPNARNVVASISDYPDTYLIPIVVPLVQNVTMVVTWNTTSPNFVSDAAIAQLAAPALAAYVNSIAAGQPMNLFELQSTFQLAVASVLATPLLTRLVFTISIDGIGVSPTAGTGIIAGDPQSYLQTSAAAIVVTQG